MKQTGNRAGGPSLGGELDEVNVEPHGTGPTPRYGRLNLRATRAAGEAYERLTGRERWIVMQLVKHKGAPNKVIAYALAISPNTLRNHLASIYAKLGVRRRVELVLYAMERGLDNLPDG